VARLVASDGLDEREPGHLHEILMLDAATRVSAGHRGAQVEVEVHDLLDDAFGLVGRAGRGEAGEELGRCAVALGER
jgi:hypothetical protein